MAQSLPKEHPLRQTWPPFLDLLETRPDAAIREFAVFAYKLIQTRPPKILRYQTAEQREDWIQEIILHFTSDDGRVLREYRHTGRPFASWFITVANNKAYDFYRQTAKHRDTTTSIEGHADRVDTADPIEARAEFGEAIAKVVICLRNMSKKCRILLQAAAEEYNPREMLNLLGKEARSNKQVSDDLRACRKRLKTLLAREGIELDRLLT